MIVSKDDFEYLARLLPRQGHERIKRKNESQQVILSKCLEKQARKNLNRLKSSLVN